MASILSVSGTQLQVSDDLKVVGDLDVDTTLNVDGATTLNSTLDVDGATTLNGAVTLGDAAGDAVTVTGNATFTGTAVFATADLNGTKLIIDADADTSITADTDDQIDIEIAAADDFRFTANTFAALSGSTITVPDGSASAPSLKVGDEQNGLFSPAANQLGIGAGGESRIVVGSAINTQFSDHADNTKIVALDLASIATATTRTITVQDSNTTLPIMTQALTFSGPTAPRTITLPDADTSVLNSGFVHVLSGPTAARTFTFPDANTTIAGVATSQDLTEKTVSVRGGTGTGRGFVPGLLNMDTASGTGSPADTNENNLKSYTVPANTLATNGDILHFVCMFRFAANAETKRVKVKFGATTLIDSTAIALNDNRAVVEGWILRTGAATQSAYVSARATADNQSWAIASGGSVSFTAPAETLSGTVVLKSTVQDGTGTLNNTIQDGFIVEYLRKT